MHPSRAAHSPTPSGEGNSAAGARSIRSGSETVEEKDRAAAVLKFYAAVEQQPLTNGETNPVVAGMFARGGAHALWEWPDNFAIETVTEQDGIIRQHVVNKRREPEEPLPLPIPVPAFEPAVPLPVKTTPAEDQEAIR